MKLQVLVSTMHRKDASFLDAMNVMSSAIVINQTDKNAYKKYMLKNRHIEMYSFDERGVGLSRNNALMRASAEFILIADDDLRYDDDYEEKVVRAFKDYPDADMIFFNLTSTNSERPEYIIKRVGSVKWHNSLRYGAFRIALRTSSVRKYNMFFSLEFGGGTRYMSGEDSLFIYQAIRKGMKTYAVPVSLGTVSHGESTWFKGYTDRLFLDKGALFMAMSTKLYGLFAVYYILKNYASFGVKKSRIALLGLVLKGAKDYEK